VDAFRRTNIPFVVVDADHETVARAIVEGTPAIWGDVAHEDILRAAGIAHARMLVLAVPQWTSARLGVEHAKRINPRVFVVARATSAAQVEALNALRVNAVVQPEFEGGVEMVRRAFVHLDWSEDQVDRLTVDMRHLLYGPDRWSNS
jgi:CPA2 family monovalent cation:H+ antiporter-2